MKSIKIKCPAKINLTLEIVNKRQDGFHNIKSIMQLIDLYDYLNITIKESFENKIILSGNSTNIPYDRNNLVYKAIELYLKESGIKNYNIDVFIEKNIPISAGLAGGSTDAAGVLFGLNKLFNKFDLIGLENLCAKLGSDLNVCLNGGCVLATSRGEVTQKLSNINADVTLIKPKNLGISAAEAYKKYSLKENKPQNNMTEKMFNAINKNEDFKQFIYNDLEYAVFDDYNELQEIKQRYPQAIMSGSGSTYFILEKISKPVLGDEYEFINNLKFISEGVSIA